MDNLVNWKEASRLLLEEKIGVIPTDTLYGLVGQAVSEKVVEKIYRIKNRNSQKPLIVLISSLNDLDKFDVALSEKQSRFLEKIWPGPISVILQCQSSKLTYLHRGNFSLAFRLPQKAELKNLLQKTGPLVAPSANPEGQNPAAEIKEAKNYFQDQVDFYLTEGILENKASTLIDLTSSKIKFLRKGTGYWRCIFWSKLGII